MTDDTKHISNTQPPADPSPVGHAEPAPKEPFTKSRNFMRQVLGDTFMRWGARIGLVWLVIVGFCAIFAPLLANSYPMLLRTTDGTVQSPMFKHFTPVDVALLLIAFGFVVAWAINRFKAYPYIRVFLVYATIISALSFILIHPPDIRVMDRYRTMEAQGEFEWVVWAPIAYSPTDRLRDRRGVRHPLPPSAEHLMGTDRSGADILSKMIHAARIATAIGFIATGIALVLGILIGGLMGYFSRIVDLLGMRLVEVFEAIPVFFLLLTFVAFFPRNLYLFMVIIGLTGWVGYARFIRAEFLKLRQQDFVQAAQALGLPLWSILFRHMLPNGVAPVLVGASFGVASAILYESTLSFLGLGLVDEPSWGQLLGESTGAGGDFYWWLGVFPGMAIFLTVFAYNLIGESMRDVMDPKTRGEQ